MRSKFEVEISKKLKDCWYEPKDYIQSYSTPGEYLPDFVPKNEDHILIEAKGRFRTRQEAKKYISVRNDNPKIDVVFIFYDPNKPMPGATKRRNGTRFSMAEWADKNDFTWYTIENLPAKWCKKK